jgi:phosphoribosylformylglycinamidine synthase subunit PurL
VVYLGAKTGRDGVGGATMASAEFGDDIEEKRPTVQVGDPFTEKRLLEACLELMATGAVIAIQDMGAAGLTCSAVEMGAKGDLGIRLDLDKVPVREDEMTPYEMMLSESQERMLMVLHPEKEAEARAVFEKWELDFATVGVTTDDLRFRVFWRGDEVADLPIKQLGDAAPEYDRPWVEPEKRPDIHWFDAPQPEDWGAALLKLIGSPNLASRRWVWEQYDTWIQGNSIQRPGGDAGVVRVEGHPTKALAFTSDVTPRYCEADPYWGGAQAVCEAYRNLSAVGAEPLAVTDNLNFGNPERPEIMGQLVGCIKGIGDACRALSFPVVSGNVSLYNETNGRAIPPTPTIGGVGLIADYAKTATIGFKSADDRVVLVGDSSNGLGQSLYLRDLFGRDDGRLGNLDLAAERMWGEFIRKVIGLGLVTACHDISGGGLAVALAEMAMAGDIGARIDPVSPPEQMNGWLFGEGQARYVLTCRDYDALNQILEHAPNSFVLAIGEVGGKSLAVEGYFDLPVEDLRTAHEGWFPTYMKGEIV